MWTVWRFQRYNEQGLPEHTPVFTHHFRSQASRYMLEQPRERDVKYAMAYTYVPEPPKTDA